MRLTEGRDSPDLTPGHHHNRTSLALSMLFRGDLAEWTACEGTRSLESNMTETPNRAQSRMTWWSFCAYTNMKRRSVHLFLPFKVRPLWHTPSIKFFLTTFFTSSNAWGSSGVLKHVRYGQTKTQLWKLAHCASERKVIHIKSNITENNKIILKCQLKGEAGSPGRSSVHYHWEYHHCQGPTLWRFELELLYKVASSGSKKKK